MLSSRGGPDLFGGSWRYGSRFEAWAPPKLRAGRDNYNHKNHTSLHDRCVVIHDDDEEKTRRESSAADVSMMMTEKMMNTDCQSRRQHYYQPDVSAATCITTALPPACRFSAPSSSTRCSTTVDLG